MFDIFVEFSNQLNKEFISSYKDLEAYKENGFLDKRIETELDLGSFINNIKEYLTILFYENNIPHYKKQLILHKNYDLKLLCLSERILCLYCDNLDAYGDFPLLMQSIAKKFNIYPFSEIPIEYYRSKFYEFYKLNEKYSEEYGHTFHKLFLPYCMNTEKYEQYNKNGYTEENMFIWAEEETYKFLSNFNPEYLEFVSRDYGDGFGYDLLWKNPSTNREELIEVKSGRSIRFTLSENEYKVMYGTKINNSDYFIYRLYVDEKNECKVKRLKFDTDNHCFIDIDNIDDVYDISSTIEDNVIEYDIYKRIPAPVRNLTN